MNLGSILISWLSHVSCWHCGNILVSYTTGGRFDPFHCNDKFLPPAMKLGQGNIFRNLRQEFCSQVGVCPIACWDTRPQEHTLPGAATHHPQEQTLPAQCMLGDTGNKRAIRILLECILVCH